MNGKTILVVEDHALMRQAVKDALGAAFPGVRVLAATQGLEAVAMSGACRPDVVVMDRRLPRLDGMMATRRIKAARPDTKVIIFSWAGSAADQRAAKEAGADGYARKEEGMAPLVALIVPWMSAEGARDDGTGRG